MLIIGRRKPYKGNEFGGVVILYELFLQYFDGKGISYEDIDLNWRNYPNKAVFLLTIYFLMAKAILLSAHKKISFHGTTTDFTYYAPFVVLLANLSGKRVSLRKFGGTFDRYYENLDRLRKTLVTYVLKKADVVFFETKHLVNEFSWIGNSIWFPNVRNIEAIKDGSHVYQKRFVFISQIKATKGVTIILEAIRKLSDEYIIHLYGPKQDYSPPTHLKDLFKKHYKGVLEPNKVLEVMDQYDVLLLPTFHKGEGYPGVILEAYSQAVPVISTKWRAVPEIVKDNNTGFLIEPKSVKALVKAMQNTNRDNYPKLSKNARAFFDQFKQEKVMQRIVQYL